MKRSLIALAAAASALSAHSAIIYSNDFETGNPLNGIGFLASTQGYAGIGFGNQYFRNPAFGNPAASSDLIFGVAGAASAVTLNFDLAVIDSWDGFNCCGPDLFNVKVDGVTVYSKMFDSFGGPSTGPELSLLVYGPNLAVAGWGDGAYHVQLSLPNLTAGNHVISFYASGNGWQGGDDESFALDNIVLEARVVPEPSTYALMALGLAGIGMVARRRRAA